MCVFYAYKLPGFSLNVPRHPQDHDPSVSHTVGAHPRWRIGSQTGQIRPGDVLLLGIVLVSDGAAMPIMQVRDDFGTISLN